MQRSPSSQPELLYESRAGLQRTGPLVLLPFEEAIQRTGYISVFGYHPETVAKIRETGTTAGLQGSLFGTEMVYLDIDDNPAAADAAERTLTEMELQYTRYFSGSRGFHFHIPCELVIRADVPYRAKSWATKHFPGVDLSIYKTSGIIRTPGTWHHKKQGGRKTLVSQGRGLLLDLLGEEYTPPIKYVSLDEDADAAAALDRLWLEPVTSGGRNQEIYRRAFLCRMAGMVFDEAVGQLLGFNQLMVHPPLPHGELTATVRSAYRE